MRKETNGMQGNFLNSIIDLHEATKHQWLPERGLREGCSTSPCLFNIYHQVVMRIAENERKGICYPKNGHTRVK